MTVKEFKERFDKLVDPFVESYHGPVIYSHKHEDRPEIPASFLNHLPESVAREIKEMWASII